MPTGRGVTNAPVTPSLGGAAPLETPGLFRYRFLLGSLVAKDLKLKYRGSFLGFARSLLKPALMLATYIFAFKIVLRVQTENYPYFVMAGLLPWIFFAGARRTSTQVIVENAGLIRRVYFPREILPIASVLFAFTQFLLALAVFLPTLMIVSGIDPSWRMALVLPVLVSHLVFTLGLAFALAVLADAPRVQSQTGQVFRPPTTQDPTSPNRPDGRGTWRP